MADEQDHVPKWHAEFVERNAREHGELAKAISDSHGKLAVDIARSETRLTRWRVGVAAVVVAIISAVIVLTQSS